MRSDFWGLQVEGNVWKEMNCIVRGERRIGCGQLLCSWPKFLILVLGQMVPKSAQRPGDHGSRDRDQEGKLKKDNETM